MIALYFFGISKDFVAVAAMLILGYRVLCGCICFKSDNQRSLSIARYI